MNPAAGYSGTPLAKKLGVKPGMTVGLIGAPPEFAETLGELPEGARLSAHAPRRAGLRIWFVRREAELAAGIARIALLAAESPVWIAWRKKTAPSAPGSGPDENAVRNAGLQAGLVDYKVCAIDETWSGLLFARRRTAD